MTFGAHTITPARGAKQTSKRLGRGNGSGKGNYSARGMKGQRARSGGKSRTAVIGLKQSILKIPKLRGFSSPTAKPATVTLAMLDAAFAAGTVVTPHLLAQKKMIPSAANGVKIVATGSLTKAVSIQGCHASAAALKAIEAAGGSLLTQ